MLAIDFRGVLTPMESWCQTAIQSVGARDEAIVGCAARWRFRVSGGDSSRRGSADLMRRPSGFDGCSGYFNGGGVLWPLGSVSAEVVKADGDKVRRMIKVKIVYVVWLMVWKERLWRLLRVFLCKREERMKESAWVFMSCMGIYRFS